MGNDAITPVSAVFPDYRALFTRLADDLSRTLFVVKRFSLGEPLSPADIQALERGYELTDDLRAFYAQMNGQTLKWFLDPALSDADREAFFLECPDMDVENGGDGYASAAIRILPLRDVLTRDWGEDVYDQPNMGVHGQALSVADFHASMRPFELFSEYHACILAFREKKDPALFLLDDHYAVWDESRGTDVRSYLKFQLATKGQSDARKRWLSEYGGYDRRVRFGQ
ncbi:SMI1/KNR4 family protein [Deinococcus radiotolerans]|uniref:Knr4/Smi1-like domain-containing protein n=1 Tax=Deinococcus radiotolerans TaxID=1309407 RepID=A0ABQ2FNC0_9DEIO|nr:SMI1/KNR4 family protein [Deinococcus radiotolerans]GGL10984.1 hypothetical protein GCM10010844_32110 [Deinococcus radiotolerans]